MKKIFILCMVAITAISVKAQDILSWEDGMENANLVVSLSGYQLQITGNTGKSWSGGNENFTIDGTEYRTIKLSNGAQNTITAPAAKTIYGVTLYSYINLSVEKAKVNADGVPYVRDSYWKEMNGVSYSPSGDGTEVQPIGLMKALHVSADEVSQLANASNYITFDSEGYVPDQFTFKFAEGVKSFTFTNTGEQVGFVAVVYTSDEAVPNGIVSVNANNTIDLNGPVYNIAGQRVGKDYKGIVVVNGKKFVR